ncbi:MAG TPA: (d)CMP kinase [Chloroflexota bacterium]|jgi:cytidylate kinase
MSPSVIAIDGPAAVGKTTVGRRVADRLAWTFLDTGVLYRALAWLGQQDGIAPDDDARLAALARDLDAQVTRPSKADGREADVRVHGVDVTWNIRSQAVDRVVSIIAALPEVRAALIPAQRRAAQAGPAVVVGRDIGTVIFPDAALKVYLEATEDERARRRAAELAERGPAPGRAAVLADLRRRDMLDSGREHAPLAAAADAVRVGTDGRSVDEVVEAILALWHDRALRLT